MGKIQKEQADEKQKKKVWQRAWFTEEMRLTNEQHIQGNDAKEKEMSNKE